MIVLPSNTYPFTREVILDVMGQELTAQYHVIHFHRRLEITVQVVQRDLTRHREGAALQVSSRGAHYRGGHYPLLTLDETHEVLHTLIYKQDTDIM